MAGQLNPLLGGFSRRRQQRLARRHALQRWLWSTNRARVRPLRSHQKVPAPFVTLVCGECAPLQPLPASYLYQEGSPWHWAAQEAHVGASDNTSYFVDSNGSRTRLTSKTPASSMHAIPYGHQAVLPTISRMDASLPAYDFATASALLNAEGRRARISTKTPAHHFYACNAAAPQQEQLDEPVHYVPDPDALFAARQPAQPLDAEVDALRDYDPNAIAAGQCAAQSQHIENSISTYQCSIGDYYDLSNNATGPMQTIGLPPPWGWPEASHRTPAQPSAAQGISFSPVPVHRRRPGAAPATPRARTPHHPRPWPSTVSRQLWVPLALQLFTLAAVHRPRAIHPWIPMGAASRLAGPRTATCKPNHLPTTVWG